MALCAHSTASVAGLGSVLSRNRGQTQRCRSATVRAASEPVLKKPEVASPAAKPAVPQQPASSSHAAASTPVVTIEYQRQQAKEMQKYFRRLALEEEVAKAQVFGWTKKNEISNGRWVMFGLLVGMLTEYATGVSFIDQLKMIVSFLGIADVYE